MFFILSKTLGNLIYPLPIACLLLLGAWWSFSRRPRLGRGLVIAGLAVVWLPSTAPVADLLLLPLETHYPVIESPPHADVVVVLAGMVDTRAAEGEQVEMAETADRILAAITLVRRGCADYLLIAGGSGELFDRSANEALILHRFAIEFGVPADRILLDTTSRNTHENAVQTRALLEEVELSDIILVTSAWHMPRSMGCFRKVGLDPLPYPVDFRNRWGEYDPLFLLPRPFHLQRSSLAVKEYVGLIMYQLQGYT